MMPLPFVKVTAKAFKRNLADDSDDSSSDSSSTSSTSRTSSTSGSSTSRSLNTNTSTSSGEGNGNGLRNSFALNDLHEVRDLNYTVPLATHDADDPTQDEFSSKKAPSTDASDSTSEKTTSSASTTTTSGAATSGSTASSTTSTSATSTTSEGGGGATASSSGFSLDASLNPNDVVDPKTGRNIFAKTDREVKITVLPEQVETPPPVLSVDPSGNPPSIVEQATHAMNLGMHTARLSMQNSMTVRSASHGFKKAKKTALLTLRIGEYVVKTQVVGPVVKKAVREWKSFNRFRDRRQAERRSKTLDWFEERVQTMKRKEGIKRQREQDERREKWRAHLKLERTQKQRSDFLNETRAEFAHRADLRLAKSLENERVRNYFLENNDGWQMQTLTRHVQEDEDRQRQQKADEEADKVREGDVRRQAAADAYLAEYDRGEVITQATLRIMRRSGIIAGVNKPPAEIEEAPLETDTYLLLRLKRTDIIEESAWTGSGTANTITTITNGRQLSPPLGKPGVRQGSSDGRVGVSILPSLVAGGGNEHHQRVDRLKIPGAVPRSSLPEPPENSRKVTRTSDASATPGPQTGQAEAERRGPSRGGGGNRKRAGCQNRGKKRSSGAFEVDLLRFRGLEEMRGWKIGTHGGESLAADLANGACPRLSVLRLGWCGLGDRGTRAIVRSLCGGGGASAAGRTLTELDLRGNAVTAGGLRVLGGALARGGLPALRVLDLGSNSLRDEGGKSVAHRLLAGSGTWRCLARLDLSGNGMGDGGVEAVFKAITAPGTRLAPDVEMITVRNNFMSPAARQRLSGPPPFFIM